MVKFRLIGIENNNLLTIFKSSGLGIEQPGKTSTRQAKKYCINRHALAHQATCIIGAYSATAWHGGKW